MLLLSIQGPCTLPSSDEEDPTSNFDYFSAIMDVQQTQDLILQESSLDAASPYKPSSRIMTPEHINQLHLRSNLFSFFLDCNNFNYFWSVITLLTLIPSFLSMTKGEKTCLHYWRKILFSDIFQYFYDIIITMHNVFLTGGAYFVIIKKGENVEKLYFDDT